MAGNQRNLNATDIIAQLQSKNKVTVQVSNGGGSVVNANEPNQTNASLVGNGTKLIRKMIVVDPVKLKQFGLDMKIKNARSQYLEMPLNSVMASPPANRTIKLVQKVKLTSALSPKSAEKIPEKSFDLNFMQQQISNKLKLSKLNASLMSPPNQSIASSLPVKINPSLQSKIMSPISPHIKIVKIIKKGESRDCGSIDYSAASSPKLEIKRDPAGITKVGSPISQSTAKRLSDVIKSKSPNASPKSEPLPYRVAPKYVEVLPKGPASVQNQFIVPGRIVEYSRPASITYDVKSIPTCTRGKVQPEIVERLAQRTSPEAVKNIKKVLPTETKSPKQLVQIPVSVYCAGNSTPKPITSTEHNRKSGKKNQKFWSKFNKFKHKNRKLEMENQELKSRLHLLLENMSTAPTNIVQPFENFTNATKDVSSHPQRVNSFKHTVTLSPVADETAGNPKSINQIERTPPIVDRLRAQKEKPNTNIRDDDVISKPNPEVNTFIIRHETETGVVNEYVVKNVNKNNLVDKSVITTECIIPPREINESVIPNVHDNGMVMDLPEIAEELEICDEVDDEHDVWTHELLDDLSVASNSSYHVVDESYGDITDDVDLEINISVDASREHDYFLPEETADFVKNIKIEAGRPDEPEEIDEETNWSDHYDSHEAIEPYLYAEEQLEVQPLKKKPDIIILENRLIVKKEVGNTQESLNVPSIIEWEENAVDYLTDHNKNTVSIKSEQPSPLVEVIEKVSGKAKVRKKSIKNINHSEAEYELSVNVNAENLDDQDIEPPAFSPIGPVCISTNSFQTPIEKKIEENIPVVTVENVEPILAPFNEPILDQPNHFETVTKIEPELVPIMEDVVQGNSEEPVVEIKKPKPTSKVEPIRKTSRRSKSRRAVEPVAEPPKIIQKNKKQNKINESNATTDKVSKAVVIKTEVPDAIPIKKEPVPTIASPAETVPVKRSQRQRRPTRLPSPEIIETPVVPKNRRRSRRSISPTINCDSLPQTEVTPTATQIATPASTKRTTRSKLKTTSQKRIKFEGEITVTAYSDDEFLGFPDDVVMPAPLPDVKIEIKQEPIESDLPAAEIIENVQPVKPEANTVTCGKCKDFVPANQWDAHLLKHNGLAFREDLDFPIDFTDERFCINIVITYIKIHKLPFVTCEKCNTTRKSAIGLFSHMQICGLSEQEQRVPCEHCGSRLLPASMSYHLQNSCSVLKEREIMERLKQREFIKVDTEDEADGTMQSGRAKRKSVKAAEKKIKSFIELIDDVALENHFTEKKPFRISGGLKRAWLSQLKNDNAIKCRTKNCQFSTRVLDEISFHMTKCKPVDEVYGFFCRHCKFHSFERDGISEHLIKEHRTSLKNINNLENLSGSEASVGEESSETDGSSGEEELECENGESGDENDEDMFNEDANERGSRTRSSIGAASGGAGGGGGGSEYKATESADALLRDYSLLIKQPHAISSFYTFAFRWTLDFMEKYFSNEALYIDYRPKIIGYLDAGKAKDYIPTNSQSPKFCTHIRKSYDADYGSMGKKIKANDWENLNLFEGRRNDSKNTLLFCGGPVLCMDWATFPVTYKGNQYLAISCYRDYNDSTRTNEVDTKKGLIQVWNLGNLKSGKADPAMKYALKVDFGPICDIKFCPSGGYIPEERLGLLAVTTVMGDVHIYSLPHQIECIDVATNIIELDASVTLQPCVNNSKMCRQAFRLAWTKDKDHSIIAAGYTDGWVAVWNLKTESKLLRKFCNGKPVIKPTKIFHPFSGIIRGIEIFYVNNSQWLMVASDKNVKLFDLKTYPYPHEVSNIYQKSSITCSAWSIHWPGYLLGLNESFCLLRNSVTLVQPHEIGYKNYPMQSFDATVTDITVSDFLNTYAAATDSGDIISYMPRDLLLNISRKGNRRIKLILGYTDVIDLDEQATDVTTKYGLVFCDMVEPILSSLNDLQSKRHRRWSFENYPIVTITRIKFNPNHGVHKYYALGFQAGFVRVRYMVPKTRA